MNSMKKRSFLAVSLLTIFCITACGSAGSGVVPGSGALASNTTSVGEIIGFGSVIVNGIEFTRKAGLADDRVSLTFDNVSGAGESRLKIGMIVKVTGTFDSATGKGEYEAIEFQPELRGRLDSVDTTTGTATVMGRTVQLEAGSQLDGITDLAGLSTDLAGGKHPEMEISGYLDGSGVLHVTRMAKVAADFVNGPAGIKGVIVSTGAGTFTVGGVNVNTAGATWISMTPADTAVGLMVDVKGTFDAAANIITAATIEKKQGVDAGVNAAVQIKGLAAGIADGSKSFILNGPNGAITVKGAAASFIKNGIPATAAIVTDGTTLQVEGSLDATGAVVATKVSVEIEKTVSLRGPLSAKDGTAGTVTVNGITVNVNPATRFIDSSSAQIAAFTLANLALNDNVQVDGLLKTDRSLVATQIQRFDPPANRIIIQGPVSATTSNSMTILGVSVTIGALTEFTKADGSPFPGGPAAFIAGIVPNVTVVKARGDFTAPSSLNAVNGEVQFNQVQ